MRQIVEALATLQRALVLGMTLAGALPACAEQVDTSAGKMQITRMAGGLDQPWSLAFLPDGRFLVTERGGRLSLYPANGGDGQTVGGLPQVAAIGQGGLLDVMLPRDFATSREVWLSFAQPQPGTDGAGTAAGRGRLSDDGTMIEGFETLFAVTPDLRGGNHFGGRLVEAWDGTIFLTTGERAKFTPAQDPTRAEGKIIALNRDGSPAYRHAGWLPGVYSMGHRNPQGATLGLDGQLWAIEHGAKGGDELNRIEPGRNYGWPVISYGVNYDGSKIGEGTAKAGMEQPVKYWDPSIAPSGLMIYSGKAVPDWTGDVFTGSLKFNFISRLDPDKDYAEEQIKAPETGRVRDVREGPDGTIWFLSVDNGAVYRMAP